MFIQYVHLYSPEMAPYIALNENETLKKHKKIT